MVVPKTNQSKPQTAKVFRSGNSQAVRLPKEFQLDVSEVEISRRGEEIVLRKKSDNLVDAFIALASVEGIITRQQPAMQERDFTPLKRKR